MPLPLNLPINLSADNYVIFSDDSDSRRAFRSMFPDAPTSNSALESQQDALLRHQEDRLKNMKDRSKLSIYLDR
jgi:hypothetical protein